MIYNRNMDDEAVIKDIYDREAKSYDRLVAPAEFFLFREKRKRLIFNLSLNSRGLRDSHKPIKVLEIGVGTGANLPYYAKDVELTAIDLSPEMIKVAAEKARRLDIAAEFKEMSAESLAFPDASFDAVVSTFTLCTIPDPVKALTEMKRVSKLGGSIFLLEHGKSSWQMVRKFQDWRSGAMLAKHRCHLTRDPLALAKLSSLTVARVQRSFFGIVYEIEVLA